MRMLLAATPLMLLVATMSGCASAPTKPKDLPDLMMPAPPPHVVPITAEPVIEPVAEVPSSPATPGAAPATRTGRGTRETPPKPSGADTKPDTKPDSPPTDAPAAPVPPVPATPAPQLRMAESNASETSVHATLDRARQLLTTVDYRNQKPERKKAYDDAKAFAQQAEDALKAGNVVFAQSLATKSETLAKELAGR